MNIKYMIIVISMIISVSVFSFCEHNDKKECLNFNDFIRLNIVKNSQIVDLAIDKNNNKYILLNTKLDMKDVFFIVKLDKYQDLVWSRYIKGVAHNIFLNSKSEVIISSDITGDIKLENKNYSFNTKSLLILKLENLKGKLKKHLFVSTNYSVVPTITKLDGDYIYIGGYYGGKSDFLSKQKTAYEDAFLLVLDSELNKKWTKVFTKNGLEYINDIKVGKDNIYFTLKEAINNKNTLMKINKRDLDESPKELKSVNVKFFDIDSKKNIYLIEQGKLVLTKYDKNFNKVYDKELNELKKFLTPLELVVKNDNLFIKYIINIEYKKSTLVSNYDLDFKNNWHFVITGQSHAKNKLMLFDNHLFLFGEFSSNLTFLDKDFFSTKISPFILDFNLLPSKL